MSRHRDICANFTPSWLRPANHPPPTATLVDWLLRAAPSCPSWSQMDWKTFTLISPIRRRLCWGIIGIVDLFFFFPLSDSYESLLFETNVSLPTRCNRNFYPITSDDDSIFEKLSTFRAVAQRYSILFRLFNFHSDATIKKDPWKILRYFYLRLINSRKQIFLSIIIIIFKLERNDIYREIRVIFPSIYNS